MQELPIGASNVHAWVAQHDSGSKVNNVVQLFKTQSLFLDMSALSGTSLAYLVKQKWFNAGVARLFGN